MDFVSNYVINKSPNFMDLELSPAHTPDKLKSVIGCATIVEGLTDGSDWITSRHGIEEVTMGRVSETKAYSDYIKNSEFETTKVFEQENISVTRPTLENISVTRPTLENISVNRPTLENISVTRPTLENISVTRPTLESISVTRPTSLTETLTRPTDFSEENGEGHIPDDPDSDPSLSDFLSKKNKHDKKQNVVNIRKMTRQTHHRATILIRPMTMITDKSDIRGNMMEKKIRSNYAHV